MKGIILKMGDRIFLFLLLVLFLISGETEEISLSLNKDDIDRHYNWLITIMDKYHQTFDVYTDLGSAGNHFPVRAKMWGYGPKEAVSMNECCKDQPQLPGSSTCIKCTFKSVGKNWGGFYFMNGTLKGKDKEPQPNWGDEPDAGYDLTGASKVTFFARGEKGGERVEFFVGGIGWKVDWAGNSIVPEKPYPDSFPKISTGYITLSREWKKYTINIIDKNLTYVLSGFGWVTNANENKFKDITFYIDEIRWDKEHLNDLRFLVSYPSQESQKKFDIVMKNVAFTYDNSLVLISFLARGKTDDMRRAKILADSFTYAITHDRFYSDNRLRNAYMGGDLISFPGWEPNNRKNTVRMPGFWDCEKNKWFEDKFQVSTHTGNVAWAMIALISAYNRLGNNKYLKASEELGEWIEKNCRDNRGAGGYTGGFEGWEPNQKKLLYKSTEHNIDLYVAFLRLYEETRDKKWKERAYHAKRFVEAMWDKEEGKFWTGTLDDGVSINKNVIPLDVQAWAVLAFHGEECPFVKGLKFVEKNHSFGGGFDFNTDRDGIWYEGTAQMATAYQTIGQEEKSNNLINLIKTSQFRNGAIPAASRDGLTTGFDWLYFKREHIGATAWYLFAKLKVNPYWLK